MTTDLTRWLEQLSTLEQENALLKSRLETCETSCALLQAEVMRYRHLDRQAYGEQSRDRLLEITAIAANTLLTTQNLDDAINYVLEMIGAGIETDRVTVIEIFKPLSALLPHWQVIYEWTSPGTPEQMSNPDWIQGSFDGIEDFYDQFCRGQPVSRFIDAMAEPFHSVQVQMGTKGLYAIPISINGRLWGIVGFDDCRVAQQRSTSELSTLKVAADCIGSAIERQRTQQVLLQTQQQRVEELAAANEKLKKTLDHLSQSEERFRTLFECRSEGFYYTEVDPPCPVTLPIEEQCELLYRNIRVVKANPAFAAMYGADHPDQLMGLRNIDVHASNLTKNSAFIRGTIEHGYRFQNLETEELDRLGQRRYFLNSGVYTIADGYIVSGWGTQIDITELRTTQQALLQTERQRVAELAQANDVLQARDRLLEATAIAANTLLTTENFDNAVNTVLQLIGEVLDTDRVKVLEYIGNSSPHPSYFAMSHEWVREGIIPQISHPSSSRISTDGAEDFLKQLFQIDGFGGALKEWPEVFWEAFEAVQAKAIYCVPIRLEGQIWGFLIFDDCRDVKQRDLSALSVLKIAANCIGSGIQQQRTQQALIKAEHSKQSAILEERNRMASEIHDTLAQSFTGISLQLEVAKPLIEHDPPAVSAILNHLKDLAEAGLAAARQSVWALYPAATDYADLAQLLYESLEAMSRNTATQIEVNVHGTPYPLPTFMSMNLLRIGQEALTNALKHAQAQSITIDLTYEGNPQTERSILLNICDDGCGFMPPMAPDAINGGFGLVSMSERCNRIGAQLSITSAMGEGTQVSVEASLP